MKEYLEIAESLSTDLREVCQFLYTHPELGLEEYKGSAFLVDFLRKHGFDVEYPYGGLKTAFCAKRNPDESRRKIAVFAEYDALAKLGHACGHNLIATAGVCAACVAAEYAERHNLAMNLRCIGTPGEESHSGKGMLLRNGAFDGIEIAIMAHPWGVTATDGGALGVARGFIEFHGRAAHAAQAPELGINALDAMMYFYMDVLDWKKTILPSERVHGIVTNGGAAANIIPDFTQAFFYVRSRDVQRLELLKQMLEKSAAVACKKTGCTGGVRWENQDLPIKRDEALNEMYARFWKEAGKEILIFKGDENMTSTDMGTVTQSIRGDQFFFSITNEQPAVLHTEEFQKAAGTDEAFKMAVKTGAVMAKILVENR